MRLFILAGLFVLMAAAASAHSRLNTTAPADGAVLAQAPAHIVLTFAKRLRLTRVRMTHDDGPAVDLELGGQKSLKTRFTVPLSGKGRGLYRIEWRGLSIDGHAMRGRFTFRVK